MFTATREIGMKTKHFIRQTIAHIGVSSGIVMRRLRRQLATGPIVLAYHRIIDDDHPLAVFTYPQLQVSPSLFTKQIELVRSLGKVLSLEELFQVGIHEPLPSGFLITFDDGWRDNFTEALPVLQKMGVKGAVFATTGFVGTGSLCWTLRVWMFIRSGMEQLRQLEEKHFGFNNKELVGEARLHRLFSIVSSVSPHIRAQFIADVNNVHLSTFGPDQPKLALSWEELKVLDSKGISIGGHTHKHEPLTLLDVPSRITELQRSYDELRHHLGKKICALSYPHSSYNPDVIAAAHKVGFTMSFGFKKIPSLPADLQHRFLPRIEIDSRKTCGIGGKFSRVIMLSHLARLGLWR
jgi:peptidoglycan/xylan/chitin deacetylase (PgdA/CDA1 family)